MVYFWGLDSLLVFRFGWGDWLCFVVVLVRSGWMVC